MMKKDNPYPDELTDRQIYNTPIGPVCMSKREYQDYQDQLAMRQANREKNDSDNRNECHKNEGEDNG